MISIGVILRGETVKVALTEIKCAIKGCSIIFCVLYEAPTFELTQKCTFNQCVGMNATAMVQKQTKHYYVFISCCIKQNLFYKLNV